MNSADVFLQSLQHDGVTRNVNSNGGGTGKDYGDVEYNTSSEINSNDPSPWSHNSVGAPLEPINENNMSITPESFQSFGSGNNGVQKPHTGMQQHQAHQQQQQQQQQQQLQGFDFSDYDDQIQFTELMPQQQVQIQNNQNSTPIQNGSFASPEDMVKSEFSPVIMNSNTSSSQNSFEQNYVTKMEELDPYSKNDEYLAKDEFGVSLDLEEIPSNDNFGSITTKTGKRRKEKTSHNVIEKKYRTSINDKIFQLRDIVPTLRVAYKRFAGIPIETQDSIDLDGLQPAKKLNKASILMKTIEYIKYLEARCENYKLENQQLKSNIPTPESLRPYSGGTVRNTSELLQQQQQQQLQQQQQQQQLPVSYDDNGNGQGFSRMNNNSGVSNDIGIGMNAGEMENNNNDYASRFLMGGLALTMGATCFGENGDMGSARALFAMPIFQFSPRNGFVLSNSNGIINLQSSIFALLKIGLLLATTFYFVSYFFQPSSKGLKSSNPNITSNLTTRDTVQFDTKEHLLKTMKKTFIINKLKYRYNSMERVESRMAKCFAVKIYFKNSKFPWNSIAQKFVDQKWNYIKRQVDKANYKTKGTLNSGLEWNMISNVMSSEKDLTLDNSKLLSELSKEQNELELKDFLARINLHILNNRMDSLLTGTLQVILKDGAELLKIEDICEITQKNKLAGDKLLQSLPEYYAVLDCLLVPTKKSCDKLSKLIKTGKDLNKKILFEEQLVLYCSVMRILIKEGKVGQCNEWSKKMPIFNLNKMGREKKSEELSIIGLTAIFLMLKSLSVSLAKFDIQTMLKVEKLYGEVRIWLGCEKGNTIDFGIRSQLIENCIIEAENSGQLISLDEKILNDLDDAETEYEIEEVEDIL